MLANAMIGDRQKGVREVIVDMERQIDTKASEKALTAIFLIGYLALPIIGGVELARFAIARPASDEGRIVFSRWAKG